MTWRRYTVGLSWGDVESAGRVAFPIIHTAGSGVLTAFGAGALVAPLTSLEQRGGLLPRAPSESITTVAAPDFVVIVPRDPAKQLAIVQSATSVLVAGGRRFSGTGYRSGDPLGKTFSFGYDAPTKVDLTVGAKTVSITDAKQVIFGGGVEATTSANTTVQGDTMQRNRGIIGAISSFFKPPAPAPTPKIVQLAIARATPASGFVFRQTPKGRQFTSLAVNRNAKHDPKKTLAMARAIAQRAQRIAARVTATSKVANRPGSRVTLVGVSNARPFGARVPRLTIAQIKEQAAKLAKDGKALGSTAEKYATKLATDANKRVATTKRAAAITKIHGLGITDIIGWSPSNYFTDIVGALAADAVAQQDLLGDYGPPVPDPTRPGYLTDGSPDPSYGGASDPSGGATASTSLPGAPDYGAGSPPTIDSVQPQADVDFQPDPGAATDTQFYDCPTDADLPPGAVVYDGSHVPPAMTLGSMSAFWGTSPGNPYPKGGAYSGYVNNGGDTGWSYKLGDKSDYVPSGTPSSAMISESVKNAWGPLIGAPTLPGTSTPSWTAGLRFSASGPSGPRWFWFWDQAPDWAKQPILQARLNDAIVAYKSAVTAGQADYVSAALQDRLDAATAAQQSRDQAKQDAALALQQQQQDAQELAFEQSQAQAQAQLDLQSQQAEMAYAEAHPDQYFGPQAQQPQGGGFDAGGGGLTSDGYGGRFSDTGDGTAIDWDSQTTSRDNSELDPLDSSSTDDNLLDDGG